MVPYLVDQLLKGDDRKLQLGYLIDLLAELIQLVTHERHLTVTVLMLRIVVVVVVVSNLRVIILRRLALLALEQLKQLSREQDLVSHLQVDVGGQLGAIQSVLGVARCESVVTWCILFK